ncbi:hypothetical protein L1987_54316 [Smallanthus sonchifolius]|uniref:Uncharacterized protein n=1 Tax=Smallanthus sonchifolius TaxID=185202 RepID=A0ACB9E6W9_9ASTR|nr:hypothetical protein L1987_54316 [Smallanthus sonchifolius]
MTKAQWVEMVKRWGDKLPVSPVAPVQKQRYVNKEKCSGRIISWFYEAEFKLFALKISDGVQYLKPRLKYFNSLPRCEVNGIEGGSGKYERLKPQQGKILKYVDRVTQKVTWRYKFKPMRSVSKISLKTIAYACLRDLKWWSDQKILKCREIMYTDEGREQALQYKKVLYVCLKHRICEGSSLPKN